MSNVQMGVSRAVWRKMGGRVSVPERKARFSEIIDLCVKAELPLNGSGEQVPHIRKQGLIRQASHDHAHREATGPAAPVRIFVALLTLHGAERFHAGEAARARAGGRYDTARELIPRWAVSVYVTMVGIRSPNGP